MFVCVFFVGLWEMFFPRITVRCARSALGIVLSNSVDGVWIVGIVGYRKTCRGCGSGSSGEICLDVGYRSGGENGVPYQKHTDDTRRSPLTPRS